MYMIKKLLLALCCAIFCAACSAKPPAIMFCGEKLRTIKSPEHYKLYAFSSKQKAEVSKGFPLSVTLSFEESSDAASEQKGQDLRYFFFYGTDDASGIQSGPEVKADNVTSRTVLLSLCPSGDPAGFGIYSVRPVSLQRAAFADKCAGWVLRGDMDCYYFGASGGTCIPGGNTIDLTGADSMFNLNGGTKIALLYAPSKGSNQKSLLFSCGSDSLYIRHNASQTQTTIPALALDNPFGTVVLKDMDEHDVVGCFMSSDGTFDTTGIRAIVCDPGLIPSWNTGKWRCPDYEVFSWEEFSDVLIFDTKDYAVQDDFFKRLAFFAEKKGFKGTLQSDDAIGNKHGFNAHDYRAQVLADFFNKATERSFPLNDKELLLKDILLQNGLISYDNDSGRLKAGHGAVVSISRQSLPYLRWQLLNHEGFHGIFFTHESFRQKMASLYETMDKRSLEFITTYYAITPDLGYDTGDIDLMQNELMAYTLQHSIKNVPQYYKNLAGRPHVQRRMPELSQYIMDTNAAGFTELAEQLDDYIYKSWGIRAGQIYLVNRK